MSWVYRRPPDVRQRRKKVPPATRAVAPIERTVTDEVDLTDDTSRVLDSARTINESVGVTDDTILVKTINVEIT